MLHGVLKTKRKKEQIVVYTSPPLHPCISHLELTGRMKNFLFFGASFGSHEMILFVKVK